MGAFLGALIEIPTGLALVSTGFGTTVIVTSTITISGAQVATAAAALGIMMMAKDPYVEYLKRGMSQRQKEAFQREIESYKTGEGRGGADNLSKDLLKEIAEIIKKMFK